MAYHFFTEPTIPTPQVSSNAFGAINNNEYRICNLFAMSSSAKAFAICNGEILVQESYENSNLVNIVIKPSEQPNLDLPKIEYIVYKGIIKNSIIQNDGIIASASNNDLTRKIWESYALYLAAFNDNTEIILPENPTANDVLGFAYSNTGSGDNKMLDAEPLNKAFYNPSKTLFTIVGGDYIGDFNSSEMGIVMAFEKHGLSHQFKLAREHDSKIIFTPLDPNASNAEKFKRKHEKEIALGYIDSCAFFSAFYNIGIKVFTNNTFEKLTTTDLYETIITQHYNKQKIYLDIRNEYSDSINYYENYTNNIGLKLDNSSYTSINYYRNNWPILVLDNFEIPLGNSNKTIRLKLPIRDKQIPTLYLKRSYISEIGLDILPQGNQKFPVMDEDNISNNEIELPYTLILQKADNEIISDYLIIKYFSAIPEKAEDTDTEQLIYKRYYIDNLFPISDLTIPFSQNTGKSTFKLFYDTGYIDKLLINASSYSHSIGMAIDDDYITFISLPFTYNFNVRNNADDTIPLGGLETISDKPFLLQITDLLKVIKLIKGKFLIDSVEKEFLKFAVNEDVTTVGKIANNYTFEDVTVFALTTQQFNDIKLIKEQQFPDEYKVYIGITNVQIGVDDTGTSYTKFSYVLNGIKEHEGEIIAHHVPTGIEIYTDQKIIGASYQRNYEEKVGFDNFQDLVNKVRYEDYFIAKNTNVKTVTKNFVKALNQVNTSLPSAYAKIQSVVKNYSANLWTTAKNHLQGNPNNLDDRPLYWARIKMLVALKSHIYFRGDIVNVPGSSASIIAASSQLAETIMLFEEGSRNYKGIDFSTAGNKKKILITGFDPFQLNLDIETQNPSGIVSLLLHGKTVSDSLGNDAYIQAAIFPVRYPDFDKNAVENLVTPFLVSGEVNMIMSLSLNGGENYFDLERFAGKHRGGFPDNLNIESTTPGFVQLTDGDEFYKTTLPISNIVTPVVTDNFNGTTQRVYFDQSYVANNSRPHTNASNSEPNTNIETFPISEISGPSKEGSGGDYLSNEIFYRIARARENINTNMKTGHYHLANPDTPNWTLNKVILETEDAIRRSLAGI